MLYMCESYLFQNKKVTALGISDLMLIIMLNTTWGIYTTLTILKRTMFMPNDK